MVQTLLKLRFQQAGGIVFACGALHAKRLLDELKKHDLQDRVLYYFPHSSARYDESIDDVHEVIVDDALLGHTHLLSQEDIRSFGKRIIKEVSGKIK